MYVSLSFMRVDYNLIATINFTDLLDRIAADLRSFVSPTAIAPDEPQLYPTVGEVHEKINVMISNSTQDS